MERLLELQSFFLHPYLGWLPSTLLLGHTAGIKHTSTGQRAEVLYDVEQPAVYFKDCTHPLLFYISFSYAFEEIPRLAACVYFSYSGL